MTCIITGMVLHDPVHSRAVIGDLHQIGGSYIVNAVIWPTGETQWQEDGSVPSHWKTLTINPEAPSSSIFERRGVVVIDPASAELNPAAKEYLA